MKNRSQISSSLCFQEKVKEKKDVLTTTAMLTFRNNEKNSVENDDSSIEVVPESIPISTTTITTSNNNDKNNRNTMIQDYQVKPETIEPKSEINPSLYAPSPYKEKRRPVLHRFTSQNRPISTRAQIPIASLFPLPLSQLWQACKYKTFNHLQSEMANFLCHSDDNIVLSAPTGAGKTAIFEMGIARFLSTGLKSHQRITKHRKIVYIAPSKALCEERYEDWSQRLSKLYMGIQIAIITGDAEPGHSYFDLANAHFILTTPEKWDSLSRRWNENFFLLASVKLLMIDEVHLLGDTSRGSSLEAVVARMKTIQQASKNIQVSQVELHSTSYSNTTPEAIASCMRLIAVSATLPNIQDVAEFLGANEAFSFDESYRPVPLSIQVVGLGNVGKNEYRFWTTLDQQVPHLIAKYSDGKQTLIFCHTKKETQNLANLLVQHNFGHGNFKTSSYPPGTVQYCLESGVAYHHAGMEKSDRRQVEEAFADRRLRCLCATSTLAVGVNLPAHLVIIKGTKSWRGGSGHQEIDPMLLLQMMGRAGRQGHDTYGRAIIMTDNASKRKLESLTTNGLGPADSQLLSTLIDVMNTEISQCVITSEKSALRWIKSTFLFACIQQDPVRYGVTMIEEVDTFLKCQCQQAIHQLYEIGFVEMDEESIRPRVASHIMSQSMIPFAAMRLIATLPFDATQCQILKAISQMAIAHFPVRRAEKKSLNLCHKSENIRFKLKGPLSKVRIQKPDEKAFLLLQAYINKHDFQEYALRQEMSILADKAQRILSSAQEYSIQGSKHGQMALQCLCLRRSLQLCLWGVSNGVLNQIQDVGHKCTGQLKLHGILSFEQALECSEEALERATGRPKPFGKRLQTVVQTILRDKLTLTAEIVYTRGSSTPAGCTCHLQSNHQSQKIAQVTFTLLVYTDQATESILFFQEGITRAGSYRFACPSNFGKLYLHLVASVVGLDESLTLDGPQTRVVTLSDKKKTRPLSRRSVSLSKIRQTKIITSWEKHTTNSQQSNKKERTASITPQQQTRSQKTTSTAFSPQPLAPNMLPLEHTRDFLKRSSALPPSIRNNKTHRKIIYPDFTGTKPSKKYQAAAVYVSPMQHTSDTQHSMTSFSSKKGDHSGSWNQTKKKQERFQQRAFANLKRDNPFSSFQHDPNDSESFLERLSTRQASIIPTAKLAQVDHSRPHPLSSRYQLRSLQTTKRRRRFGQEMSNQDLLHMKAAEQSQHHFDFQQWKTNSRQTPWMSNGNPRDYRTCHFVEHPEEENTFHPPAADSVYGTHHQQQLVSKSSPGAPTTQTYYSSHDMSHPQQSQFFYHHQALQHHHTSPLREHCANANSPLFSPQENCSMMLNEYDSTPTQDYVSQQQQMPQQPGYWLTDQEESSFRDAFF
jgi:ATP-dependent DNA helicase HFM1/MER3